MAKITVITPTVRPEGLALVAKALKRQTLKDFEWVIIGPNHNEFWNSEWSQKHIEGADRVEHTAVNGKTYSGWSDDDDSSVIFLPEPEKKAGDAWSLNKAMNEAIREASGDLIVSWQDYTYAKPDTLERFWTHFEQEPKTLVGAVGNKYADGQWTVMTWKDPRERDDQGPYYPCYFSDIEWNLASVPKQALYDVGGFDEEMDQKYGMDGYSVNDRINLIGGYDFKLDQTIKSYSLEHGRLNGGEWDKNNWNGEPYLEYRKKYVDNPKLPYLG